MKIQLSSSKIALFLMLVSFLPFPLFSQSNTFVCPSDEVHQQLLEEDENYAAEHQSFENYYKRKVKEKQNNPQRNNNVYTIPVVVHILHAGAALGTDENPTDATIASYIEEASMRFRQMQSGAPSFSNPLYGVDTEIELCLATKDPDGNFTNGIVRYSDPDNATGTKWEIYYSMDDRRWDGFNYCNLVVATNMTDASGFHANGLTIYDAGAFWPGLICHELGHYFGLAHIFQGSSCLNGDCTDDGDKICDTPPKSVAGYSGGTCGSPSNTCTSDEDDTSINNPYRAVGLGGVGDQPDMLENYLDYTGPCWNAFTDGQKTRMRSRIEDGRTDLIDDGTHCSNTPIASNDAGISFIINDYVNLCDEFVSMSITLNNYGSSTLNSTEVIVENNGNTIQTYAWNQPLPSGSSVGIVLPLPVQLVVGMNNISIKTNQPNGFTDGQGSNDASAFTVEYFGGNPCAVTKNCADINLNTANGPGNTTLVSIPGPFTNPASNIRICATVQGDSSTESETFEIYDEAGTYRATTISGTDCLDPTPAICFSVASNDYNNWIADGTLSLTFNPVSTAIDPNRCSGENEICVELITNNLSACATNMTLSNTINSGTYQVSQNIMCSGTVASPDVVNLKAGNCIELSNGFEVENGAQLEADIEGCN